LEPDEPELSRFKRICQRHFETLGLEVHLDVPISDDVRWRPHLFAKNNDKIIVDIVEENTLPQIQLRKYGEVLNAVPQVRIYIVIIRTLKYLPEIFADCNQYGIGVYVITDDTLKEILSSKERNVENLSSEGQIAIRPGSSYGNVLSLRRCFRQFRSYLYWFERNLPRGSLELLYDNLSAGNLSNISEIKLLRGIDDKVSNAFKDDFDSFRDEVSENYDIEAQMRIITDNRISNQIHGRYIYSTDASNNTIKLQVPPLNSLNGDQWDSIFTNVQTIPNFLEFWNQGIDFLSQWSAIETAVRRYRENKIAEARRLVGSEDGS
jgi:hypothetical protein